MLGLEPPRQEGSELPGLRGALPKMVEPISKMIKIWLIHNIVIKYLININKISKLAESREDTT